MNPLIRILAAIAVVEFASCAMAQELSYFENTYHTKLTGIAPKSEQKDLNKYYTDIADQLGITKLAFSAVREKYGWGKEDGASLAAFVSRKDDSWEVSVFLLSHAKTPNVDYSIDKKVGIDDSSRILYCEDKKTISTKSNPHG